MSMVSIVLASTDKKHVVRVRDLGNIGMFVNPVTGYAMLPAQSFSKLPGINVVQEKDGTYEISYENKSTKISSDNTNTCSSIKIKDQLYVSVSEVLNRFQIKCSWRDYTKIVINMKDEDLVIDLSILPEPTFMVDPKISLTIYRVGNMVSDIMYLGMNSWLVPEPYTEMANKIISMYSRLTLDERDIEAIKTAVIEGKDVMVEKKEPVPPVTDWTLLGEYSMPQGGTNAALAAKFINGTILQPGEIFSYNKVVGPRTLERGFVAGRSIVNGTWALDIGGGVCRTSTALHNAVLNAGLQFIERHSHTMQVSYAKPGLDAAVAYGILDYRFINNTGQPVRIDALTDSNKLTIQLWKQSLHVKKEGVG